MSHEEVQKFILNFIISGSAAAASKTMVAPIDRIKLIIQNQDSALQVLKGGRKKYSGIINVLIRTPKEQGILSFWRGNGTNLIRYFPAQALNFSFKDLYTSTITDILPNFVNKAQVASYLAGGLAGMSSTAIVYPLEFCQTKITVDVGSDTAKASVIEREYCGLPDCLKKVYREEGFKGFYRGLGVATVGVGVYRAMYFGMYDDLKRIYSDKYNSPSNNPSSSNPSSTNPSSHMPDNSNTNEVKVPFRATFVIAQIVAATSGIISYPFDTIGRRLMMDSGRPKELMLHKNWFSAAKHIYVKDGMSGFFKGWIANVLRSVGGALVLVTYDQVLYLTNWKEGFNKS